MEKITLTFLGTGSAIPTARKNHPAVLLKYKDENLLFDCGEGTQRQFRKAKLNPCKITKIFISHWHGDHILGLPGLLQTMILNGYNKKLEIYGPKGTSKKMAELNSMYLKLYKNESEFNIGVYEIEQGKIFENGEFKIEATKLNHGNNICLAYSFEIKEKNRLDKKKLTKLKIPNGPLLGDLAKGKTIKLDGKKIDGKKLLFKESARKITLINDTKMTENAIKIAKDSNLLICESTYSVKEKEIADEHYHLTSDQAATIAKKAKVKKLILTHLSQRHETKPGQKQILEEAKKVFKETTIAEDFDVLEI